MTRASFLASVLFGLSISGCGQPMNSAERQVSDFATRQMNLVRKSAHSPSKMRFEVVWVTREKGKPVGTCGTLWDVQADTRYKRYFIVTAEDQVFFSGEGPSRKEQYAKSCASPDIIFQIP